MNRFLRKTTIPTLVALSLVAGTALAAISLSYNTSSSQTLGTTPPPVIFEAGADSSNSDYVNGFSISTNSTYYTVTVKGVPEAQVTIDELFKIKNQDDQSHSVTVSTGQVSDASNKILTYQIEFYNGGTLVDTLDLTAASPSANLGTMAAGDVYTAKVVLKLDSGAGNDNVGQTSQIALSVSS